MFKVGDIVKNKAERDYAYWGIGIILRFDRFDDCFPWVHFFKPSGNLPNNCSCDAADLEKIC